VGKEAVPEGVETDGGFPLLSLWSRGAESVRLVSGLLSFARHGSRLPLILHRDCRPGFVLAPPLGRYVDLLLAGDLR
jgi:hypothetical protein